MSLQEQSRLTAWCTVTGLGCLIAFVFLTLMSRLFFADYDRAFSYQLPLTVSGDLGCLVGLLLAMAVSRIKSIPPAIEGYIVAFVAAGVVFASLLKLGCIVPFSFESLIVGDFLVAVFTLCCAYLWWIVYAAMGERAAIRRLALALVVGMALFLLASIVPVAVGRLVGAVVLPLVMCLCFLPIIAQGSLCARADGSNSKQRAPEGGEEKPFPKVVLVTIALSFFVADLELDLFPISLYFEGILLETLPLPALSCLALLLAFAAVLYGLARRGPIPLPFLYTSGFILTAAGYLITPYRLQGGFPLAASEAGRIIIVVFALVLALRFIDKSEGRQDTGQLFQRIALVTLCSMLAADVLVVVMQMQPGFDYGDFVFRTVFSGFCIAVLVVLLLGPLPRTDKAFGLKLESAAPAQVPLKDKCEEFARRHDLSARETEVFTLLASGRDVPYIEKELVLAKSTVKTHTKHIYEKCSVSSRQDLLDLLEDFKI